VDIEQAIIHLDEGIRRLKVQYDIFFAGGSNRPPTELKEQIDRLIKRFANAPIRKYSHRFHFNSLVARYNSLSELWNKQVRAKEEGRDRSVPGTLDSDAASRPVNGAKSRSSQLRCVVRISDPDAQTEGLRQLFDQYAAARRELDGAPPRLSLSSFINQLSKQVNSLRSSSGCRTVEFRIIKGSSVSIKARPANEETT
jgi:hypothetical protein